MLALAILIACILVALRRVNWKTTVMFLGAAAVAWFVLPRMLPENLQNRLMEGTSAHTLQTRFELWQVGLNAWLDCPIQGVGSNAYAAVTERDSGRGLVAHNTIINVLVKTASWASAVHVDLVAGDLPDTAAPGREKLVCLSLLCSFIPVLLSGSAEYAKGWWWLYGIILALWRACRCRSRSRARPGCRRGSDRTTVGPTATSVALGRRRGHDPPLLKFTESYGPCGG